VAQIVAITRDIHQETEAAARALQAEVELAKAQQLASIGRLAGAVGHELANPLAAALMGLETVMLDDQRFDLEMGNTLAEVRRSLGRAASVLSELNLLARETRDHASIDLDRCVEDVLEIAASRVSNRVDARLERTPLVTDPARCHQLVYNMLTAHLAGLPDGSQHARIHIDCRLVSDVPTLTMRSAVQLDRQMMVADLVSALRGEEGRYEVPLALARHVADALGARWSVRFEDGLTWSTVEFPDQSAVPVRTS
jgi:C4-dicarboxylate-specific signal transduction histidine kinase